MELVELVHPFRWSYLWAGWRQGGYPIVQERFTELWPSSTLQPPSPALHLAVQHNG